MIIEEAEKEVKVDIEILTTIEEAGVKTVDLKEALAEMAITRGLIIGEIVKVTKIVTEIVKEETIKRVIDSKEVGQNHN